MGLRKARARALPYLGPLSFSATRTRPTSYPFRLGSPATFSKIHLFQSPPTLFLLRVSFFYTYIFFIRSGRRRNVEVIPTTFYLSYRMYYPYFFAFCLIKLVIPSYGWLGSINNFSLLRTFVIFDFYFDFIPSALYFMNPFTIIHIMRSTC